MIPDIKNIIFDLGGVILDIDYNRPVEAFKRIGIAEFDEVFSQQSQAKFLDQFERGELTPAQFRKHLRQYLPENVTDAEIDTAW